MLGFRRVALSGEVFETRYRKIFGSNPQASFVGYLPTLMPVVLPIALFGRQTAALLFSWMNFGAAMILFWCCYCIVRETLAAPLELHHWLWVVLASTIGGVAGTEGQCSSGESNRI